MFRENNNVYLLLVEAGLFHGKAGKAFQGYRHMRRGGTVASVFFGAKKKRKGLGDVSSMTR